MRSIVGLICVLQISVAADPKSLPKTPLSEPRERLQKGNYAEARAGFAVLAKDAKYAVAAAMGIAESHRQEGHNDKALAVLNDAITAHAGDADLLAARADIAFTSGQWDAATADITAALKTNPNHFAARWVQARLLRDSGKLDEADTAMRWFVRTYTAASNADKDITDPDTLLLVGQAGAENARWHNLSKQFSFIINDVYADALKFDPHRWQAEWLIGTMLLEKYNRPDAVEAFDKALAINPNAAEPYVGKGEAALSKYDIKEAEEFVQQALKRNPNLLSAHVLQADLHLVSGDYKAAEKSLTTAVVFNPRDEAALGRLAAVMTLKKQDITAIVKQVEAFDSKPGQFYYAMAKVLEDRKQYSKAEEHYKRAAELRPKFAEPRTALGLLYLRMGRETEGRKLLDEAFAADKFNVRVANSRKVLDHLEKYSTLETPHYTIRYDTAKDKLLATFIAEALEETHAGLKKEFQFEPAAKVPFQIFSRHDMFSGRTIGLPDLHTVGASTGRIVAMASPKAQGVAKPFNWGRVVKHELVHVFNLMQTDQQCPHWVTEGLAVRNEKGARPYLWLRILRDRKAEGTLFTLDTIMMGFAKPKNQNDWTLAYCQANLYVEHLVKVGGEVAVAKVLKAYADGLDTDAAIRAATNTTKAEFEKSYLDALDELLKPYPAVKVEADATAGMKTEELREAIRMDENNWDAKARLAERCFLDDKHGEARKLADEVLTNKKGHPVASQVKANLLLRAGDTDEAKNVLEAALVARPNDARLLMTLSRMYVEAKEYDLAIATLEAGRKLAPLDGDWSEKLVKLYIQTDEPTKLAGVLQDIIDHDPDDLGSRLKLGELLLKLDKPKDAVTVARQAIEIDVTDDAAQMLYVEALTKAGDTATAETMRKRFAKD